MLRWKHWAQKIQLQDRNEFIFGKQFNRYYLMLPVRAYLERICSRSMESYFIWLRISCRLGLAIVLCLFWISLLPITFSSLPTIKLRQRTIEKHKNKLVSLSVRSQALVFVKEQLMMVLVVFVFKSFSANFYNLLVLEKIPSQTILVWNYYQ